MSLKLLNNRSRLDKLNLSVTDLPTLLWLGWDGSGDSLRDNTGDLDVVLTGTCQKEPRCFRWIFHLASVVTDEKGFKNFTHKHTMLWRRSVCCLAEYGCFAGVLQAFPNTRAQSRPTYCLCCELWPSLSEVTSVGVPFSRWNYNFKAFFLHLFRLDFTKVG